jgi:hypothetical protein
MAWFSSYLINMFSGGDAMILSQNRGVAQVRAFETVRGVWQHKAVHWDGIKSQSRAELI